MFSFHSKYFVYRELKRAPQKLSFCFKCPDTGTVRILDNILYARLGVRLQQAYNSALLSNTVSLAKTSFDLVEVECSDIGLVLSDRKTRVLTCNVESQPPLRSRQGQILEEVSDFKYLDSRVNSSEKDIKVRNSLAWQALNDTSSIWSSSLFRDLKIRLFQATIDSVLLYGCKGGSLTITMVKSPNGSYTPMLGRVHNTSWRDRVTNAHPTATFQLYQKGSAWSCWPLLPQPRIASKPACHVATNSRTPTTRAIAQCVHSQKP